MNPVIINLTYFFKLILILSFVLHLRLPSGLRRRAACHVHLTLLNLIKHMIFGEPQKLWTVLFICTIYTTIHFQILISFRIHNDMFPH
jgi:hypothetical protein